MKSTYYSIAGAALILFLLYGRKKRMQDTTANGMKGVSKVDEAHPTDGTSFTGDIMSTLNGADFMSPNHNNILPGANADGGGHTANILGLSLTYDGSIA